MNKKTIWKRWYMIVLYCFIGLMFFNGIFSNECNCDKEQEQIKDLKKQINNLEDGIIKNCEWGKAGAEVGLSYIEFMEIMGMYTFSQYKESFKEQSNVNCYEILEKWR
jgi:hypothetical protein